ncbi:NRDE family protein [Chitinimonas sp. BJYL2]|uniref:NRDE family protein n=1 Tax=Chitinimonas sp. BJYL2 TaxID=2976696 RepID=UPI0022B4D088|nr:NRDE family protein [Chitinimonas sp. BJYL2]
MCLIGFHWDPHGPVPLRVAANRDEFYARPTAAAAWWDDDQRLGGRDLQAGGSWMGLSRTGRFAALTNYRDPRRHKPDATSRGALVADFLASDITASDFLHALRGRASAYNDFNLLVFDGRLLLGYESHTDRTLRFGRGAHAVSNGGFDSPWPKVERLRAAMADDTSLEAQFALLADTAIAPDARLPSTGVPLEWERALSALFIRTPEYGTRASTVLSVSAGHCQFIERSFDHGVFAGEQRFTFSPQADGAAPA